MISFVEKYDDIGKPVTVRSMARNLVLDGLSLTEKLRRSCLSRPQVHLIYLHHVFADEVAGFKALLSTLQAAGVQFVSHAEAVEKLQSGSIDGSYASFSFDDGLKSCMTAAAILEEFGTTGCFFVNGKVIDSTPEVAADFCKDRINMPPCEFMSWDDLQKLAQAGHEVGNHMFSHYNSADLSSAAFAEDLEKNHDLLSDRVGAPKHFAWPYGGAHQILLEQLAMLKAAGYLSASSAQRGTYLEGGKKADIYYLLRDHCIARWPLRHTSYLLARSVRRARR